MISNVCTILQFLFVPATATEKSHSERVASQLNLEAQVHVQTHSELSSDDTASDYTYYSYIVSCSGRWHDIQSTSSTCNTKDIICDFRIVPTANMGGGAKTPCPPDGLGSARQASKPNLWGIVDMGRSVPFPLDDITIKALTADFFATAMASDSQ